MKPWQFSMLLTLLPFAVFYSGAALSQSSEQHGSMMGGKGAPATEPELANVDELKSEIRALRLRVAALEELKPSFSGFMPNFAERFHVMHRAADAGDWAVAAHENGEMMRLTRISRYIDPKLGALMQGFMDGNLAKLGEAIEHGNPKSFEAALKDTLAGCNGCHTAAGSTIAVTLNVDESLSMRHPHLLRKSTVPEEHEH